MNIEQADLRGRPLIFLALLLSGWVCLRIAMVIGYAPGQPHALAQVRSGPTLDRQRRAAPPLAPQAAPAPPAFAMRPSMALAAPTRFSIDQPLPLAHAPPPIAVPPRMTVAAASGHTLLFMAALAHLPLPESVTANLSWSAPREPQPKLAAQVGLSPAPFATPLHARSGPSRWSADGWVLLRGARGAVALPSAAGFGPSYGNSQAGAVLRYRLAPGDPHRPFAYLRGSGALAGGRDQQVAVGFGARPLARLPLVAAIELRAARQPGGTRLRPAVSLVSEFPPLALPLGLRAEAYLQGGYVGGAGATAFGDGQLRVDRRIALLGQADLRAGGGVWGGAQRGAARLDGGPGATLDTPMGPRQSAPGAGLAVPPGRQRHPRQRPRAYAFSRLLKLALPPAKPVR